jgi:hypothetical protein
MAFHDGMTALLHVAPLLLQVASYLSFPQPMKSRSIMTDA